MNSIKCRDNYQKKAMMEEIHRQCSSYWRKSETAMVAFMLWQLHEQYNKGKIALRNFWERYSPALDDLLTRYEMGDEDALWLCIQKLKDIGVDIEAWQNEGVEEDGTGKKM